MKKFLAILLALVMVLAMVACGGNADAGNTEAGNTDAGNTDASTGAEQGASGGALAGGAEGEEIDNSSNGEIGLFDPEYDYSANPRYKIAYYVLATGVLYEATGDAIEHWCSVMNMEYGGLLDAGGDKDAYLSNLQTLAAEYDGLIMDPDAEQYKRCSEILNEAGCAWMGNMAAARDYSSEGAPLLAPYVGFDNFEVGTIMLPQLLYHKEQLWPDVDISEFGFESDYEFCEVLAEKVGVGAVPGSSFFREPVNNLIRFHFAKNDETLYAALERLADMRKKMPYRRK